MRRVWASQQGQGVIELTLSLIIFSILMLMIASLSLYLYIQHSAITAAREGARLAAVTQSLAGSDVAGGKTTVRAYVQEMFQRTTGQNLPTGEIEVLAPGEDPDSGPVGQRNVSVEIVHEMENPIFIAQYLAALGAPGSESIANITIQSSAQMRFEE